MKLSKIALSLVAVAGIVQVGGAWYTGKQVETRYNELVTLANNKLQALKIYNIDAEYKDVTIERSLFSSDLKYNLVVKNYNGESYIFKGADTLHHGPFPLNRLIKGKLLPVMISDEGILYSPNSLKSVFKDGIVLTANIDIDYSSNLNGKAKTNPVKSDNLKISEIETKFDTDKNGVGDVSLELDSISINDVTTKFIAKDMEYKFTSTKSKYPNLSLGDYVFNAKTLQIIEHTKNNIFSMNDLQMEGKNDLNGEKTVSNTKMKTDISMKKNEITQDFGEVKLNADFVGDAKTWNDLIGEIITNTVTEKLVTDTISKGISLKINNLSFENKQGKNDLNLDLNVKPFDPDLIQSQSDSLSVLNKSSLNMKFNIPANHLTIKKMALLEGKTEQEAQEIADTEINTYIDEFTTSSDFFVVDDKNVKLKLVIDNKKVLRNGKEMSEQEISQMLMIIIFASMGASL
ncbi:DUF945 family protein [Pasteurella skyensis]|uniref:DUF945 family protein n=1 Tax=Phocoenobacter skyensis TaxID=97481 RepID=A0AAJ6NB28_9PAST|nr:DUF945 family protein [Pasteurella skyensis]MDP8163300.1 DUF945 family protein [Pasteurella skyensis]MDP8173501.1 DUF945 family protein [Pasteurella skyensis]MDP8177270.1 DUF945 family protein [Pasteurella skyensis]MDP8179770.1 DUF945 family protein [Pasteurella skyensis]MDP8183884.1 DUF945 family protein [Pasteurella skyensis]